MEDQDPSVALAAAHALDLMHDNSAYEVYYEILNGDRKAGKGLIASQTSMLHDPKKMAEFGFEQGIGFVPFAGIGWGAIKAIRKDDCFSGSRRRCQGAGSRSRPGHNQSVD